MLHYQIRKIYLVFEEISYVYRINFINENENLKFNNLKKAINIFGRIDTLKWAIAYLIDQKITENNNAFMLSDQNEINTVENILQLLETGKQYEWYIKYNSEFILQENKKEHILLEYENKLDKEDFYILEEKRKFYNNNNDFNYFLYKNYKKEVIENYYEKKFLQGERINCHYLCRIRKHFREKFQQYNVKKLLSRINKIKFDIQSNNNVRLEWIIELEVIFNTRLDEVYKDYILSRINTFQKNAKKIKAKILKDNFQNGIKTK